MCLNNILIKIHEILNFDYYICYIFIKFFKKLYITLYYNFNNYSNIITYINLNLIYRSKLFNIIINLFIS